MDKVIAGTVLALGVAALLVGSVIWGGLVLQLIWNWHAAPFTAIKLNLSQAIGLSCLISVLKGIKRESKTEDGKGAEVIAFVFVGYGVLLLIAYLAHVFA